MNDLRARAHALKRETWALYYAYRDPRTPLIAKLWALFVLLYALSPIDLIPDFIPILGYLDDVILVPAGIALAIRLIPAEVMEAARLAAAQAEAWSEQRRRQSPNRLGIIGAVLTISIWILILFLLITFIINRLYN